MDQIDVISHTGPFVSLTLPIESSAENAEERLRTRWGNARRDLSDSGADEGLLDRMEGAILGLARARAKGVAVVASADGTMVVQLSDEEPDPPIARCGLVPSVLPVLEGRAAEVPHLVVVADREGADIWVRGGRGDEPDDPSREVDGDTEHIHRGQPGGWSQRRFQQRAENTWEHNAAGVADEVHALARKVDAELIVATGDTRALGFLEEHLPTESREIMHVVEGGGRSDDDAAERAFEHADHLVSDLLARHRVEALERFAQAKGQDLAVEGAADTLEALAEARVALLLVGDDPQDQRTAWSSPDGSTVADDRKVLEDLGIEPVEGRIADVAVRAAMASGAEVQVAPAHGANVPRDGLGAILRG